MLYIHIPFCKGKCIYCDFYSGGNPDWKRFFKAAEAELNARIGELKAGSLSSVYFGGGTPSLIPPDVFRHFSAFIFDIIRKEGISVDPDLEFTIEVNPEDVTPDNVLAWKQSGVNRVSMGVQSLSDADLRFLRRRHSAAKVREAAELLRHHFYNISVDLIYGLPGQTGEALRDNIGRLLALNPTHISAYALTYEPGTPLHLLRERGDVAMAPEEAYLAHETVIASALTEAGFERYEISNYALSGYRSRHNSGYWSGRHYLGIGPSAASFNGRDVRRVNPANLRKYVDYWLSPAEQGPEFYEEEVLSDADRMDEMIFLRLRTAEGLDLDAFGREFGASAADSLMVNAARWIDSGDLIFSTPRLFFTPQGFSRSDYIVADIAP